MVYRCLRCASWMKVVWEGGRKWLLVCPIECNPWLVSVGSPPTWSTFSATRLPVLDIWLNCDNHEDNLMQLGFLICHRELILIQVFRRFCLCIWPKEKIREAWQMNDCYAHCVSNVAINNEWKFPYSLMCILWWAHYVIRIDFSFFLVFFLAKSQFNLYK